MSICALFVNVHVSFTEAATSSTIPDQNRPLNIFLLHGLGGDESTFCQLPKVLKDEYGSLINVVRLYYKTGEDSEVGINYSIESILTQIRAFYQANAIPIDAPMSFIGHSQGGLVALKYTLTCALMDSCSKPVPQNIKHLISLGTPFWGSPGANSLQKILGMFFKKKSISPEYFELGVGNEASNENRKQFLAKSSFYIGFQNPFKGTHLENLEILNFAGEISKQFSWAGKFVYNFLLASYDKTNGDGVVTNSSARIDFKYYLEHDPSGSIVSKGTTNLSSDYFASNLAHTNINSGPFKIIGGNDIEGMACVDNNTQLTARYISLHLNKYFGIENEKSNITLPQVEKLSNFSVELKAIIPKEYERPLKRLKEEHVAWAEAGDNSHDPKIRLTRVGGGGIFDFFYLTGTLYQESKESGKSMTFYHDGVFKDEYSYFPSSNTPLQTAKMKYVISVDGFEPKEVVLEVSPSFNTYAELYLKPFRPLPGKIMFMGNSNQLSLVRAYKLNGLVIAEYIDPKNENLGIQKLALQPTDFPATVMINGFMRNNKILAQSLNQCYFGKIATTGVPFYKTFNASTPSSMTLERTHQVKVIGRYKERYLIQLDVVTDWILNKVEYKSHYYWIPLNSVYLLKDRLCNEISPFKLSESQSL